MQKVCTFACMHSRVLKIALMGLVLSLGSTACSKVSVPPPFESEYVLPPSKDALAVGFRWQGNLLTDTDWIRSYTQYRIVYDDMENTTGSIMELMKPAVKQALHQNDLMLADYTDLDREPAEEATPDAALPCTVTFDLVTRDLNWYPRREFIQTTNGIRPGYIVTYFEYRYCLNQECQDFKIDRKTPAHSLDAKDRIEIEAGQVLKKMQSDLSDFLKKHRKICGE